MGQIIENICKKELVKGVGEEEEKAGKKCNGVEEAEWGGVEGE